LRGHERLVIARPDLRGDAHDAVAMMIVQVIREGFLAHAKRGVVARNLARRFRKRKADLAQSRAPGIVSHTSRIGFSACPRAEARFVIALLIRPASLADVPRLEALIDASVRGLQTGDYSPEQIDGALRAVYGVDTRLIEDATYYAADAEDGVTLA